MTDYSPDVLYAYSQLGIHPGADMAEVEMVLADARAYPFTTPQRLAQVMRHVAFFVERSLLGQVDVGFEQIRKNYYALAMRLHPDRGTGDREQEEQLKRINAAYAMVDAMHREAREYYQRDSAVRQEIERDARQAAERAQTRAGVTETTAFTPRHMHARDETSPEPKSQRQARQAGIKFVAASVPRYIRNARLFYLGRDTIIGSRLVKNNSGNLVYDVIMLPEQEFMRAKLLLSLAVGQSSSLELTMSKMTPAYSPVDARSFIVPPSDPDPWGAARAHFRELFKLKDSGNL